MTTFDAATRHGSGTTASWKSDTGDRVLPRRERRGLPRPRTCISDPLAMPASDGVVAMLLYLGTLTARSRRKCPAAQPQPDLKKQNRFIALRRRSRHAHFLAKRNTLNSSRTRQLRADQATPGARSHIFVSGVLVWQRAAGYRWFEAELTFRQSSLHLVLSLDHDCWPVSCLGSRFARSRRGSYARCLRGCAFHAADDRERRRP